MDNDNKVSNLLIYNVGRSLCSVLTKICHLLEGQSILFSYFIHVETFKKRDDPSKASVDVTFLPKKLF